MQFENYKKAFKLAAIVAPAIMAALAYFFGDFTPVVQDVCNALLPSDGVVEVRPSTTTVGDAGAPR
jgi:hypothetical protein